MSKHMICRCFGQSFDPATLLTAAGRAARLIAGVADYDAYLTHATVAHPEAPPLTRQAFFEARQAARYGQGGGLRCC